ncbi:MAG: hypothetical protein K0Q87_4615 [Neobacillus sp.]|nr:hypothetical protein [Neobacillus sp.]
MGNRKKFIFILGIVLIGIVAGAFIITNLRDKEKLISKIQFATNPGKSGNAFNEKGKIKYSDLSLELRKKITKEQFESIQTFQEAQIIFNNAFKEIKPLPKDAYVIDQPILWGTLVFNNKKYSLDNQIVIGYDWFIKPVIIQWYIDISSISTD